MIQLEEGSELERGGGESQDGGMVIMCLDAKGSKLGCAVFDNHSSVLSITANDINIPLQQFHSSTDSVEDYEEVKNIICSLVTQFDPKRCVISSRLEQRIYSSVQLICEQSCIHLDMQSGEYFKPSKNMTRLNVKNDKDRLILDNITSNWDNPKFITARTLACVIKIIDEFSLSETPIIMSVNDINLKGRMILDKDTFESLKIFPSAVESRGTITDKLGISNILKLFDHVSTAYGKKLLKSWLANPLTEKKRIEERLEMVEVLTDNQNLNIFEDIATTVKNCPDIFHVVSQLQNANSTYKTWIDIVEFLRKCINICHIVSSFKRDDRIGILSQFARTVDLEQLFGLRKDIEGIIDLDLTSTTKAVIIMPGVDPRLDEMHRVYRNIENILTELAAISKQECAGSIQQLTTELEQLIDSVYVPQLGFLITVDSTLQDIFDSDETEGWDEYFKTETTTYFKTSSAIEMDKRYGDVVSVISDLEIDVLYKLQLRVQKQIELLCNCNKLIGELDVFIAFAKVANLYRFTKPLLTEKECVLEIKNGRHPLYETFVDSFIPNDINSIGGDFDDDSWNTKDFKRITIVTGANASGKSVFLSQVGLIVYLSHIGSFVPADYAKIGLTDKILSRIRTRESIMKTESSFELDSKQMAKCLNFCTEKSILLIDEYGKGTDIFDGPALFGSIIKHLALRPKCPRTIACTHFHDIFKQEILPIPNKGIQHYATQLLLDQTNILDYTTPETTVTFLFSVKKGISDGSFGIHCARSCGIKKDIIDRAFEISSKMLAGHTIEDIFGDIADDDLFLFHEDRDRIKAFLSWDLSSEQHKDHESLQTKLKGILNGTS